MIYKTIPKNFSSKFEVVSCYIESNREILLLHRQDNKSEGNTWGVPAGKINKGEIPKTAMVREIFEETSFKIDSEKLNLLEKIFVKYPNYDFIYYMFHLSLEIKTNVTINPTEHKDFIWKTPAEALKINLMPDLDQCIKLYYKNLSD